MTPDPSPAPDDNPNEGMWRAILERRALALKGKSDSTDVFVLTAP